MDKNKPKPSFRRQPPQQQVSQLSQVNGPLDVVPGSASEAGIKDQRIQQLKGHLAASNSRFEAVAIVLQQTLTEVWKFLFMKEEIFYVWNAMDIIFPKKIDLSILHSCCIKKPNWPTVKQDLLHNITVM